MAILEFMAEAGRPVKEEEISKYFDEIFNELFALAFDKVKRGYGL